MRKYSIQPGQGLGASVRLALVLGAVALTQAAGAAQPASAAPAKGAFTGAWSVQWCDKSRPAADCGGFTVYLLEQGGRICGAHDGATPGLTRLDEGKDNSVVGTAVGSAAVLTIQSGRSESVSLATVKRQRDALDWVRTETITKGNGDTDVIANKAVLRRVKPADVSKERMDAVRAACKTHWGAAP